MLLLGVWLAAAGGLAAAEAGAAKYAVAQCGWDVGSDSDWGETATRRFNHTALCRPGGSDSWTGVHMRTYTRPVAGSAAATTLGRWRWVAPSHTSITKVTGAWWHRLRNGFQHRLGGMRHGGGFDLKLKGTIHRAMSSFATGFHPPVKTFESRLLCARASSRRCDTSPASEAMVRALTITLHDGADPEARLEGSVTSGGWLRGEVSADFAASDRGSGLRYGETIVDGSRVGLAEHRCHLVSIGGEVRGRKMRPCGLSAGGSHSIDTTALSDGKHSVVHCAEDFAGNRDCAPSRSFRVDNNPPAAPVDLAVAGVDGWSSSPEHELRWRNPSQGAGSPVAGASYRVTGPGGDSSGPVAEDRSGIDGFTGLRVEEPGEHTYEVWLRDGAGHERAANAAEVTYRFDDLAPEVAFEGLGASEAPGTLRARVTDRHSGPAEGAIEYRAAGEGSWTELATEYEPVASGEEAVLTAPFPAETLEPGEYELRVRSSDRAGNEARGSGTVDGASVSVAPPPEVEEPSELAEAAERAKPVKAETRVIARLEAGRRSGRHLTVRSGVRPVVTGRLLRGSGDGLPGRELGLLVTPEGGARWKPGRHTVETGPGGRFRFELGGVTSRRVEVRFDGSDELVGSRAPDLGLKVRSALAVRPARRVLARGQVLRMRGRVSPRAAWIPPRGKLVAIQYLETRAREWRPIAFARTDSRGRFHTRYRFRYITRPARIRLRAVALPEARWPYAAGASRAVTVRVLPRRAYRRLRRARARRSRAKVIVGSSPFSLEGAARPVALVSAVW